MDTDAVLGNYRVVFPYRTIIVACILAIRIMLLLPLKVVIYYYGQKINAKSENMLLLFSDAHDTRPTFSKLWSFKIRISDLFNPRQICRSLDFEALK